MQIVTETHSRALARLGYALSDPARARILMSLRGSDATPSDLVATLGASKQAVSNHLACLRGCGLVEAERRGRNQVYRLTRAALVDALDALAVLTLDVDPDCCGPEGCTCR
ncbi:winged helix-turn-helix domain-containing protein [Zhihengliuella somnathii]